MSVTEAPPSSARSIDIIAAYVKIAARFAIDLLERDGPEGNIGR